jgi:hypothetical protein
VSSEPAGPAVDFVFDIDGVKFTMSISADDAPKVLTWSTSEVIHYLGTNGPLFQTGLRKAFGLD